MTRAALFALAFVFGTLAGLAFHVFASIGALIVGFVADLLAGGDYGYPYGFGPDTLPGFLATVVVYCAILALGGLGLVAVFKRRYRAWGLPTSNTLEALAGYVLGPIGVAGFFVIV